MEALFARIVGTVREQLKKDWANEEDWKEPFLEFARKIAGYFKVTIADDDLLALERPAVDKAREYFLKRIKEWDKPYNVAYSLRSDDVAYFDKFSFHAAVEALTYLQYESNKKRDQNLQPTGPVDSQVAFEWIDRILSSSDIQAARIQRLSDEIKRFIKDRRNFMGEDRQKFLVEVFNNIEGISGVLKENQPKMGKIIESLFINLTAEAGEYKYKGGSQLFIKGTSDSESYDQVAKKVIEAIDRAETATASSPQEVIKTIQMMRANFKAEYGRMFADDLIEIAFHAPQDVDQQLLGTTKLYSDEPIDPKIIIKLERKLNWYTQRYGATRFRVTQDWGEIVVSVADRAENHKNLVDGGIDINGKNLTLDVTREGKGIEMKLDPAMVARFERGDFTGVVPVILKVTPLASPLPLLGMSEGTADPVTAPKISFRRINDPVRRFS